MIYGTGARVVLSPGFGVNLSSGPVRHLDLNVVYALDGRDYEAGLDAFFEDVLNTCAKAQDGAALDLLIAELRNERKDPEQSAWRRLEARLGYDADEAPPELIEGLADLENDLGEGAIEEAATAVPGREAGLILNKVVEASQASNIELDLSIAEEVPVDILTPGGIPWRLGEEAAWTLRKRVGLSAGPMPNADLAELLRAPWSNLKTAPATAQRLPYAARLHTNDRTSRAALQTKWAIDRRFELARIIGDEVWARQDRFGVIGRAKTERQKFQRAFAQSLLCPFSDLHRHVDIASPTEEQISHAARVFDVRPSVVQTLLVNKGVLPRETLEDRLEAA